MRLDECTLVNFRLYRRLHLEFPPTVTIVQGDNASGKTTLLEAIYLLATTKSHRAGSEIEVIARQADEEWSVTPVARVEGKARRAHTQVQVEIAIGQDERADGVLTRKRIRLNGVPRRAIDVVGQIEVVLFTPEDLQLVPGAPAQRRRYLDITLSQIDPHYVRVLQQYHRVVAQRNHLLRHLRESARSAGTPEVREQLAFWDEELIQAGADITERRAVFLAALAEQAGRLYAELTGTGEDLQLGYEASAGGSPRPVGPAARAEQFRLQLEQARPRELHQGITLVGPHRDDLRFLSGGLDLATYGSRGQQRAAVLALKMGEVEVMTAETGETPILLLDDVASELDPTRRQFLTTAILARPRQVIITATDLSPFPADLLCEATLWQATRGTIRPYGEGEPG